MVKQEPLYLKVMGLSVMSVKDPLVVGSYTVRSVAGNYIIAGEWMRGVISLYA